MNYSDETIKKTAVSIAKTIENNYSGKHQFDFVNERNFKRLDLKFYKNMQNKMEAMGFKKLGDIEDKKLKELSVDPRTFLRIMVNSSATVSAAFYHVKPALWWRLMMFFGDYGPMKLFEFETEFSDGRFLTTTIASPQDIGSINDPEVLIRQHCQSTEDVEEVYREHLEKIEEIKQKYSIIEVKNDTIEKICQSQNRQIERIYNYKKSIGWILKGDLKKWTKDDELADLVYLELQKMAANENITR